MEKLKFKVLHMSPENTNSVLVTAGPDAVIFDAWGGADSWATVLAENDLNLRAIYATHGHFDHISAAPQLSSDMNVSWYMNHKDIPMILAFDGVLAYYGLPEIPENYKSPIDLRAGVIDVLPGLRATVFEMPGHSMGGVAFYFQSINLLIIGDTIFQDGIGRYDLPGGSLPELLQSITRIYKMNFPDNTVVIHGHGADTTIGELKRSNPYFKSHDQKAACDNSGECCGGSTDHECKCADTKSDKKCCGGGCSDK